MKKSLLILSAGVSQMVFAQFPNVLISTLNEPEEVCIAINPRNTNQIVAASNINNAYQSTDAGYTWTSNTITCPAYGVAGDPVVIWDTSNACYYMHLSIPNTTLTPGSAWLDRIVIQKSTDFGQNYNTCTAAGKNGYKAQDKPWAVVNPANNEIHITWTQFDIYGSHAATDSSIILYSKSTDGGNTWANPKRISWYAGDCIDEDNTTEGAVPAIGPLGEVYVAWAGPKGLVFQKSTDGGTTWLPQEKIITSIPGGWDYYIDGLSRCDGLPFTFCDLNNGPHKGTIYINWSDQRNGATDTDVWLVKSTDGGNTWTAPKRVNDDAPGRQQFMSAMTIDQVTGYVYVLFYDRRNHSTGNKTDVYMAVSTDGGDTFANYKVNASEFSPDAAVFFGDYIGISAHNNVVRPIWTQMENGNLSVYTAIVDPLTLSIYNTKPENLSLIQAKPNPFKTETTIEFTLLQKLNLSIRLLNSEGKIIHELTSEKEYTSGTHTLTINSTKLGLPSGVYYLVVYGDEKSKYLKLVVE